MNKLQELSQNFSSFKKLSEYHYRFIYRDSSRWDVWPTTEKFMNLETKEVGEGFSNLFNKLQEITMALDFTKDYSTQFELIPNGEHPAMISGCEWKTSQKGDKYLKLTVKLTKKPFTNRVIFTNLNVYSSNDTAKNIAMAQLKGLLKALDHDLSKLNDLSDDGLIDLIANRHFMANVKTNPAKGEFPARNDISTYLKLNETPEIFASPTDLPF